MSWSKCVPVVHKKECNHPAPPKPACDEHRRELKHKKHHHKAHKPGC